MSAPNLPQMITGYWLSQALAAAARFGFATQVADGAKTAAQLAEAAGTDPDATMRLLRALASVGCFVQLDDGRFAATPMSSQLADPSLHAFTLTACGAIYRAWGDFAHSIQTGAPAFDKVFGKPVFAWLGDHPAEAELFDRGMTGVHGPETEPMLDAYDFSAFSTVVDVGGGNGSVLAAILRRNPSVRGKLFDLDHVADRAAATFAQAGVGDRCDIVAGSFFESVPAADGPTAYLMRHILHDWDDAKSTTILRNCAAAMRAAPGSRALVVEMVIPPGNDPAFGKWLDLMMLVIGGKERTAEQYRALFAGAGLQLERIVPTTADVSIVESAAS